MPHLLALPTELLRQIVIEAVSHSNLSKAHGIRFPGIARSRGALFNLSLTCKSVSEVALSLLYQHLVTHNPPGFNDAVTSMIRTLCTRPNLAAHVTELAVGGGSWLYFNETNVDWDTVRMRRKWQISPDDAEIFNQCFRDYKIAGTNANNLSVSADEDGGRSIGLPGPYQIEAIEAPVDAACDDDWNMEALSALSGLALISSINVQRLIIESNGWTLPRMVKSSRVMLDKLEEINWSCSDADAEFTLDSSLNWVFKAAPALKKLACVNIRGIRDVNVNNVTELSLRRSYLYGKSVEEMCKSFPKLKRLTIEVFERDYLEDDASPSYIVGCLARHYETTLTYLKLDWSEAWSLEFMDLELETPHLKSLSALQVMKALAELVVVSPLSHRIEEPEESEESFWSCLLPPNLEVLRLEGCNDAWNSLPLLSAIKSKCEKMEKVTMECRSPPGDATELQSLQETGSVGFEFEYKLTPTAAPQVDSDAESQESDDSENSGGRSDGI
ncbi:hypothetical protein NLG97_g2290 [Lecanicillium saksenae]|uniref:Uncharacterized protein n=1 Tax=Lecanicillium saksenae TaxID=468837 RepID=A0ACC1R217_9HYPO|nr:hypothetical protein NLG97_g2290 [Lecanicillium saksenae]